MRNRSCLLLAWLLIWCAPWRSGGLLAESATADELNNPSGEVYSRDSRSDIASRALSNVHLLLRPTMIS